MLVYASFVYFPNSCIYGALFALVFYFLVGFVSPKDCLQPQSGLNIFYSIGNWRSYLWFKILEPKSGLDIFSFIDKSLSHLQFKMNLILSDKYMDSPKQGLRHFFQEKCETGLS